MLAIIIPYYKLTYFEATLKSLANQSDKRFKVFVGDDASPEDCTPLIAKYKPQFDLEYHRFETNFGGSNLTQQWKRCIELKGDEEWLMILGDDDMLESNVVQTFHDHYCYFNSKSKVIRFATKVLNQIENKSSDLYTNPICEKGYEYLNRKLNGLTRGSLSEFVFKSNDLIKTGFTDYCSAFFSDDRMVLDLSNNNYIYSINESVVIIRIFPESISGKASYNYENLSKARFEFYLYLLKKYYYYLNKSNKIKVIPTGFPIINPKAIPRL